MSNFYKGLGPSRSLPESIDEEVEWDKSKTIMSRTDRFGVITNVNQVFVDVCGYSANELIGEPHNIIRHPHMPKIVFKVLWDNILKGNNFHAVVKNLSKSGRYYWVITDFEIEKNAQGEVVSILARRKSVPTHAVEEHFEPLYATLLKLERIGGMELSSRYFKGFLEKQEKTYVDFIMDVIEKENIKINHSVSVDGTALSDESDDVFERESQAPKRKGFFARFFSSN